MNRAGFLKRAGLLLLAPTAARAIDFGALAAPAAAPVVVDQYNYLSITRGTTAYFKAGDVLRNELTGENMRVTAIHSEGLTVDRGFGSVRALPGAPHPLTPAVVKPRVWNPRPVRPAVAWLEDEAMPIYHEPYVRIAHIA